MKLTVRLKHDSRDIQVKAATVSLEWYKNTLKLVYKDRLGNILGIYKVNQIDNIICEEKINGKEEN